MRNRPSAVVEDLPPAPKPSHFEKEGAILRAALAKALSEPWQRLAQLEAAVEGIRPYLRNTLNDGKYLLRGLDLNRAMGGERPAGRVRSDLSPEG